MVKISSKKITTTLANACIQRPYLIIIICLFFCIVAGSGAQHLQFSNSYRLFFSDENPELHQYDNFLDTYNKSDLALIVLHNPKGHIIDKKYASTIEWLTNESWQLPFITRVDSISNFQYSYSVDDDLMVEDLLFNANQASNQHLYERTNIALAEPVLSGNIISSNGDTTAIVLTAHLPEKSLDEPTRLATAVRELADNVREKHPELKIALSGVVMLNNAFSEASLNDMQSLIPLMYLILIITTILVLRSAYAAVTAVLVVCLSVIFAMGISGYINIPLSPVAIAAPTIIMTLAIADSIHVLVSMLSDYRENGDKEKAIRESIRVNFSPICITSITTIIGFLTLNFSRHTMAKEITGTLKLQIPAGQANPSPPVGPALGQAGLNIMEFCKDFNARTQGQAGDILPVVISVYKDKSFSFICKQPPASALLKKAAKIASGSGEPHKEKVATITKAQLMEIVKIKKPDLNARDDEAAARIIAGSARQMGIEIDGM